MAETAGIDYSQYANWKTITAPTGAVYYIVPNSGYVYDPFLSSVKGRPVLFTNPSPQVEERDKAKAEKDKAIKAAEEAASPMGQLLPVVGSVGGLVGANYLANALAPSTEAAASVAGAAVPTVASAAPAATSAAPSMLSQAGDWVGTQADAVGSWINGGSGGGFGGGAASTPAEAFASSAMPTPGSASFVGPIAPAAQSGWSLGGVGSAGNYLLPVAGGLGAIDLFANERTGTRGALQGAASGAALGSYFGPMGALIGGGIGLGAGLLNRFGDKDMWKTEGNKLRKLSEQGVYVPDQFLNNNLKQGRSKEELIAEAKATGGNVQFAEDRKESSLRPQDIIGYASFAQKDPQWFRKPLQQQLAIAQQALDAGAVREHHGTIDVDWNKMPEVNAGPPPANQGAPMAQGAGAPAVNKMGMVAPQTGGPRLMPGAPQTGGPLQAPMQPQPQNPNQWYIDKAAQGIKDTGQPGQQWYIDKAAQGIKDTGAPGQQWYIDKAAQGIRDDSTKATGKVLAKRMDAKSKKK